MELERMNYRMDQSVDDVNYKGISVLVAEADAGKCISICSDLEKSGVAAEWVCSTDGVLEAVKAAGKEFDDYYGIILGIGLPGIHISELIQMIKYDLGKDSTFIVLVADDAEKLRHLPEYAEVNYFISRPVSSEKLEGIFGNSFFEQESLGISDDLKLLEELQLAGKRVLLVEDNEMNRDVARELLEITGIEVIEAINGQDAVDIFKSYPRDYFDIILMDIQMPVLNGYEAADRIRAMSSRHIPIVAMTANVFPEDVKASMDAGMEGHLAKPLDMKKMAIMLDKCLNNQDHKI